MSKTQNGLLLLGVAILINAIGRLLIGAFRDSQNMGIAGFLALLMVGSVALGLFGLFRLITGLLTKK